MQFKGFLPFVYRGTWGVSFQDVMLTEPLAFPFIS